MYADPVEDAAHHGDAQDAYSARVEAVEAEIRQAFTVGIRKSPVNTITVPIVSGVMRRVKRQELVEAISDSVGFGKPLQALLQVLKHSECVYAAALRTTLAEAHIKDWAEEVAEVSQ